MTVNITALNTSGMSVIYAECHTVAHYAECHYAECLYAGCRGAIYTAYMSSIVSYEMLKLLKGGQVSIDERHVNVTKLFFLSHRR